MVYKRDFIPEAEAEFDAFFKNYCQVVSKNTGGSTPVWDHIPAARVTELNGAYAAWYTAWGKLKGPHTHADVVAKDGAHKAGEDTLREFHNEFILYSRKVTDEQLAELGCSRRDPTPSFIPAPTSQATAELAYTAVHELTLRKIHAIGTLSADPRSDYGVSIHYGILDPENPAGRFRIAARPVTGDDLPHSVFTKKKKHVFNFEGDTGKTIWFSLCYENEKGDPGPYVPLFQAIIP
jgi:hypothetical protein